MAGGGELIIDNKLLKLLDSVDKKLEKVAKSSGRAQDHISKMFNKVNVRNVDGIIQKLRLLEKKYSTIGQNDSRGMKRIANDARKTADEINKLIAAVQQRWTPNFKGAMNYSQNAKTLSQDREAINRLRQARENLSRADGDYFKKLSQINAAIAVHSSKLRAATGASHEMRKAHSGLMDISGQLTRKLALVFSVSQVHGYINKIVQVRREFELQQKALGAILRDQDKGDELWNQTIQLAVKSPFRVKELITYTKQLAAYRIETEKLHDTTRMLADVSAGLGVDMNRLILAYGQVRAAEYLRGTELRQFTEAGIPLLAELAEHFTQLEGRAVSTADVFEMISKRMVTFADVSQVFQKMTSEGGVFFQMQEKQSETLHGLINNLYDSVDLMMDAIGKENEGTIVGFLKSVKSLAESWREVAVRIKDVGTALLIAKSAQWVFTTSFNRGMAMNKMSLLGLNLGIKESTISFNKWIATLSIAELKTLGFSTKTALLQKAFAGIKVAAMGAANAIASFLPMAIIYGLYELYMALTKASREAERLRKELSDTVSVDVADLDKAIVRYENLANRLGMVNKGSMAHKEIISALNKEYGEYLDFLVNEETTVAQLNAAYDNLVETMRQKQSMEAFQKGMDTIAEHYRTQITEANKTFRDEFGKIGQLEIKTADNNQYLIPTSEEVEHIFNLINQKVRETKDVTSIDDLTEQRDLLNSVIEEFYGKDITLLGADYDNLKFIELMVNQRKEELQLQKEIDAQFRKSLKTREANLALTALQNKYEEDKLKIVNKTTSEFEKQEELSKLKDKFELDVIDLKLRFNIIGDQEAQEEKDKIINWAKGTIGDINEAITSELGSTFSGEELSKVLFTRELKETKTIANYLKDLKTSWESQNKVIAEQISLKSELGELDENNEKILQDALRKEGLYRRTLKLLGVEIQYTERLSEGTRIAINSLEGLPEEMQISLEQAYGGIDNILSGLKKKETEHLNVIRQLNELKQNGLPYDEQRLKIAEQTYRWTKKLQDLIDPDSKTAIAKHKVDYINSKLEEKYQIGSIGRTKDEVTLLSEANTEKEAAIAYEKQLNAQKAMGLAITQEQLDNAKKETEQTTLKWKLLGGTKEEGGGGRANSLYDERLKVIDDMNKKYKELNRTLDKTNSLQGAFDAYKDAFAEAFAGIKWIPKNVQSMTPQEFASQVLNFPNENDLVKFLDRLAEEPMKTFEKIKVELAKGEYVYDMKVRAKIEEDENLLNQIEEMFSGYEVSLELQKLNIPKDWAKDFFDIDVLSLDELKEKVDYAFTGVEYYSERVKDAGKLMQETFKGNVDLLNRKLIPAQELAKKGWEDVGDGIATVFSSSYSVQDASGKMVDILVTPILPDGTVLSQKELENYIAQNIEGAQDILKADKKGIIIHSGEGLDKEIGDYLHSLQEVYYAMDMLSEDQEEAYKKFRKKIDKMEEEAQQKRLKEYIVFARGAIGERAKVKMEEMQKLEDIEKAFTINDTDSEETKATKKQWRLQAIEKAHQEANDAIKKLDWEAFKSSDTFNMVFDDLDRAGQESLNNMIDKLKEFRNQWKDMPFDQMRQVTDLLQKAEEAYYSTSSPFAEARRLRQAIKKDGRTEEQALLDLSSAEQELVTLDNIIAKVQLFQQIKDGLANQDMLSTEDMELYQQFLSDSVGFYNQIVGGLSNEHALRVQVNTLAYSSQLTEEKVIDLLVEQGKLTKDEADKAKKRITDADRLKQKYQEQAKAIGQMQQMANDLYGSFYELATNVIEFFGSEISETGKIFAEAGQEMMNTVFATLELQKELEAASEGATDFGMALNSAMGIIGWIVMAVQIISKVFSVFAQLHDNKLQKQIENITDKVETLRKAFEKLEKQMDEAYQIDTINDVAKRGQENLEQQIESTRKMIALEREKKDTDEDKIKEWQDEIEDANEKLKELEIERRQALGGLGGQADYKSASEAFVDAWLTAFRETGDGMQGLEEQYDEMMTNMIKKQLTTRVAEKVLAPFYSYFDSMFDETSKGGARVTEDELRRLEQLKEDSLMQMNDQLSALSTIFGKDIMGQVELGTLQKGIQGITEQQADILASYLNTIRFFVAEQNSYLQDIAMAQGVSQRENPMVEHLKVVAEQTTAIHELLDNLLVPHPTQSGRGLKVVI